MRPFISCLFCVAAGLLLSGNPILATPTKADPTDVASTRPDIDEEPDGLTNQEEAEAGAFPYNAYSDADSVMDGVDGWALNPELHPPRFSQSGYALIRLTAGSIAPNAICINNKSHVLFHSIVNFDSQSVTTPASIWNGTSIIVLPDDLAEVSQLNENDEVVGVIYHRSGEDLEISQDDLVKWNASTGLQTMTPVHTNTFDKGYESFAIGSGTIFSRYIASNSENTSAWIGFAKWTTGSPQIQDDEYTWLPGGDMSPTVGKSFYPLTANNNNLLLGQMINFRRIPVEGPPGRYSAEHTDWKYAVRIADTEIALQDFVQGTPVYASDLSNSNPEAFVVAQLGSFEDLAVFAGEGAAWRLAYRSSTFNDKVFGAASRINSNAQMIGSFTSTYGTDHAGQLINNAVAVDLQKYLPLGTTLTKAIDINDSGIILATVTANNASDAALLVPFEFTELNPESGFDKYTESNWLMVPQNQQNWMKAITPANAGMEINFKVVPGPGGATVTPDHTNQSPETLTVSSPTLGDDTSVVIGIGTAFGTEGLKLSVKKYKPMTVTLHVVTQQDGGGAPDVLCLGPGPNGVIDTSPGGDDTVGGGGVRTGSDGLCDTTAQGDDVQILRKAIKVAQPPSSSDVQQMLTKVFGLQVNTYFTVSIDQKVVDYDVDRDRLLDINVLGTTSSEQKVLEDHVKSSTDYNLYYIHNYVTSDVAKESLGFAIRALNCAYIKDGGPEEYRVHTAAHEIGHIFGLAHPDVNRFIHPGLEPAHGNDKNRLMYGEYNPENLKPSLLFKFEWDVINPKP